MAQEGAARRASIADVARAAGVSNATASRAVSGRGHVSPETRAKVLAAAARLRYRALPAAVGLVTGRSRSVGVILPFAARWYFAEALRGVDAGLRRHGYDLVLHVLTDDARRREFFDTMPVRGRVDGVVVIALPLDDREVAALRDCGSPIAAISEPVPGIHCDTVDNEAVARSAMQHLLNGGHRRIACIGGEPPDMGWFTVPGARTKGYRAALAEAHVEIREDWIVDGCYTAAGGEQAMATLLSLPGGIPTAVFCQSDEMAFGALHTLRRAGLRCPDDVSVIGIDGHDLAAFVDLTTVVQPVAAQAEAAVNWLVSAIEGVVEADSDERRLHPVAMTLRGSTARLASSRVVPEAPPVSTPMRRRARVAGNT